MNLSVFGFHLISFPNTECVFPKRCSNSYGSQYPFYFSPSNAPAKTMSALRRNHKKTTLPEYLQFPSGLPVPVVLINQYPNSPHSYILFDANLGCQTLSSSLAWSYHPFRTWLSVSASVLHLWKDSLSSHSIHNLQEHRSSRPKSVGWYPRATLRAESVSIRNHVLKRTKVLSAWRTFWSRAAKQLFANILYWWVSSSKYGARTCLSLHANTLPRKIAHKQLLNY